MRLAKPTGTPRPPTADRAKARLHHKKLFSTESERIALMKLITRSILAVSALALMAVSAEAKTFVFCSEASPEGFDPALALQVIGYDTRNLSAAIVAFKRHYIQNDLSVVWTPFDLQVLYNIFLKQEG